jgi:hypothetical protein
MESRNEFTIENSSDADIYIVLFGVGVGECFGYSFTSEFV